MMGVVQQVGGDLGVVVWVDYGMNLWVDGDFDYQVGIGDVGFVDDLLYQL